jgi:hypothetical protein|nr:MAG TPA: holin [Caudoviricetes sp.]
MWKTVFIYRYIQTVWYSKCEVKRMDISILGSCVAIVMICYIVGMGCKASKRISDEWIPVIMAVIGGILGAVGMGVIPDFPATDYITAVAVGMFNGLSATGVNQVIKQTVQKE